MRRSLTWLVWLFGLIMMLISSKSEAAPKHPTVMIGLSDGTTWSGVIIDRDTVLTASAYLDPGEKTFVISGDKILRAEVARIDGNLAYLKVRNLKGSKISPLDRNPRLNETMTLESAYGSYKGRAHELESYSDLPGKMLYSSFPCVKGAIGSGVWIKGRLVGIMVGTVHGFGAVRIP